MLPIRDDNPTSRVPVMTIAIIALNLLAFLVWEPTFASGPTAEPRQETFFYCHAEIAWETIHRTSLAEGGEAAQRAIDEGHLGVSGQALQHYLGQRCPNKSWLVAAFAAMFLHAGWLHLLGNLLFLVIFGNNIEDRFRKVPYLLFYLLSGYVAAYGFAFANQSSVEPLIGASGAISGVLGAYLVLYPRAKVWSLVPFLFFIPVRIPAWLVLGTWFVLQWVYSAGYAASGAGSVAYLAHIFGFLVGVVIGLFVRAASPPPRYPVHPRYR